MIAYLQNWQFPVMKKSWNFRILLDIMENYNLPGKLAISTIANVPKLTDIVNPHYDMPRKEITGVYRWTSHGRLILF